jgi:hypothetical protein
VPRRVAVAVLQPPTWTPPGLEPRAWRAALAEDLLDVLATMAEVEAAVAVRESDADLVGAVGWPGLRSFVVAQLDVRTVLAAAGAAGFDQAALLAPDAPDLPGMIIAKLLRPLTTRPLAVAPSTGGDGLLGLAAALPAPAWIPDGTLDDLTPHGLRRLAPAPTDVGPAATWHRLRSPADLQRLDPRLEGWDATRALLTFGSVDLRRS